MPKSLLADPKQKDDYFALVRAFPLKKIRTAKDHAGALKVSGPRIGSEQRLSVGESQNLDALVVLIRESEQSAKALKLPVASGVDVLKHLLAEHAMSQRQLAELLGIGESASSVILTGARELTKTHIEKLSRHFGVGVGAFFG